MTAKHRGEGGSTVGTQKREMACVPSSIRHLKGFQEEKTSKLKHEG